jgi:hypothetical protein
MDCDDVGATDPPDGFQDNGSSLDSNLEKDLGEEEDILSNVAPVGGWCSSAMKDLQSNEMKIARVRA